MAEAQEFKPRIRGVFDLPREERFVSGHRLCAGCPVGTVMRILTKIAGKDAIIVNATGCLEVSSTPYPYTSWMNPWIHSAFENTGAVASGIEAALRMLKAKGVLDRDIKVIAVGGDGGTVDIGLQSLSGMLERGHKVMYVLYDNEAYMNTGIQRSGATPWGAWTTTTPVGSKWRGEWRWKKDIMGIVLAHRVPYAATASPSHPIDMAAKFEKALYYTREGPTFVHVIIPCTAGWKFDPSLGIKIARLAVETGMWVLYEVEKGKFRVTVKVRRRKPVREYLKLQGRFRHLTDEEIEFIQKIVDSEVERVNKLAGEEAIGPLQA
ncbi:pyruvate synthase subunit PorB [Stetteria hydrogenophila]